MPQEITWQNVLDTAINGNADLEAFSASQQKLILDMTHRRVQIATFQDDTFDARRYYAAHWATLAYQDSAGEGTISSESVGEVSVGKTMPVNNPTAEQNMLSTQYGRSYYYLSRTYTMGIFVG